MDMTLNYDDLDRVYRVQTTQRYVDIMQKVEEGLVEKGTVSDEYNRLIVDCNQILVEIENEIVIFHNFIREKYKSKFQELESFLQDPIDYVCVVKQIGNETDLSLVDLKGVLPTCTIMFLTALTTKVNPLTEDVLKQTIDACDRVLDLDVARTKVLEFVESKIAPNLSAIVGADVAAKLMGTAGGLSALANMRPRNVQVLGHNQNNVAHVGYLAQTEIFQSTHPSFRIRVSKSLAANSTLAARVDVTRGDPSGIYGKALREDICTTIGMWHGYPIELPLVYPKRAR